MRSDMNKKARYEESRYEEVRRLGQELHLPIPETFWELEVRDRDGRIIQRLRQRSHSWVRNDVRRHIEEGYLVLFMPDQHPVLAGFRPVAFFLLLLS